MQALFNKCSPKGGKLSAKQFEVLVSMLSEIETKGSTADPSVGVVTPGAPPSAALLGQMKDQGRVQGVVDLTPRDQRTDVILSPPSKTTASSNNNNNNINENLQDDEEAAAVAEAFQELSGGARTVSLATVAEWDLVAELMEEGTLTRDDLEEFFRQAGDGQNDITITVIVITVITITPAITLTITMTITLIDDNHHDNHNHNDIIHVLMHPSIILIQLRYYTFIFNLTQPSPI